MVQVRRLTQRERTIATTTIVAAVAAALYVYAAEPLALRGLALHRRVQVAEQELAQLRSLVEHRDTIEQEYRRLKGAVTVGSTEQEVKVALLAEVDGLARSCAFDVSSVRPTTVAETGDFYRYGVELQAGCEGHQFVKFLQAMQEPDHLLHADLVSLVVGGGQSPLTVTLRISKLAKLEEGHA